MFAVHYHKQTGEIRSWGSDDGRPDSFAGPDYAIARFEQPQDVDPLRHRIDVARQAIVTRTLAERAEAMRLTVTNSIAAELDATDRYMITLDDRHMPTQERKSWRDYRQTLRDLSGPVESILAGWPHRPDGIDAAIHLRDQLKD